MRIGSLFSGIGGLELGLEWAGVGHTVWQVEQDKFCLDVLAHHWPNATRYPDVRDVGAHNLEPVDVICGGFPCQDISYAGKGAGLAGERSGLWYEFARIVGEMGPRCVVVENVAALLTRGLDAVLGTLADLGYDAEWSTIRASDVGAPHRRERVFIVAYAASLGGTERTEHSRQSRSDRYRRSLGDSDCRGWRTGSELEAQQPAVGHQESMGDANDTRPQGHGRPVECAGERLVGTTGQQLRQPWADAVPIRGADGTVRLIPAEAAAQGPESPLRALVDGFPDYLARRGGLNHAYATDSDAAETLCDMWVDDGAEAIRQATGGRDCLCEARVLFAFLCELAGYGDSLRGQAARFPAAQALLRELRCHDGARCASPGREPVEQLARQLADRVSQFPHALASRAAQEWREYARSRPNLWPVAASVPGRVARLRALGNAVVPQVAEVVGRRLLAIDAAMREGA